MTTDLNEILQPAEPMLWLYHDHPIVTDVCQFLAHFDGKSVLEPCLRNEIDPSHAKTDFESLGFPVVCGGFSTLRYTAAAPYKTSS